jgi:hypothetical protein
MEFDELINSGWGRHETETEQLALDLLGAVELVEDAGQAAAFSALASHTLGEHMGNWGGAATLIEGALHGLSDAPALTSTVILLGVAQEFAGDAEAAASSFERARGLAGDDALVAVRTHFARASAYMGVGDSRLLIQEHRAGLEKVAAMADKAGVDRLVAIISNNLASHLLGLETLSDEESNGMLEIAAAARTAWFRAGDWVQRERADYLMALVHNRLADWEAGLKAADEALATIAANGEEPIDEAFLQLARAQAFNGLQEQAERDSALGVADALASEWGDGLKAWYEEQRAKSLATRS